MEHRRYSEEYSRYYSYYSERILTRKIDNLLKRKVNRRYFLFNFRRLAKRIELSICKKQPFYVKNVKIDDGYKLKKNKNNKRKVK